MLNALRALEYISSELDRGLLWVYHDNPFDTAEPHFYFPYFTGAVGSLW